MSLTKLAKKLLPPLKATHLFYLPYPKLHYVSAMLQNETVEEFIPQMLNFQLIGNGISFNKGCYTGQEVVARMEYLGKLKRYMQRFIINDNSSDIITPNPGTPLYTKDKKQSVGNVVVAISLNGVTELLAVITEEAVTSGEIYTDSTLQQKIQLLPLPYAIPKE